MEYFFRVLPFLDASEKFLLSRTAAFELQSICSVGRLNFERSIPLSLRATEGNPDLAYFRL